MILGIDTSLGTSVALLDPDGVVRAQGDSPNPLGHAEVIGELIRDALETAGPDGITQVAAGMGPGPFTGLRVGIAAARAFALGRAVPVVPVVSHDAVALEIMTAAAMRQESEERFAVVTDARRREFAVSVYSGLDDDGLPVRVSGPALCPREEVEARVADAGARRHDAGAVPAVFVALAAARAVAAGREIGPADALYLRSPDVTLPAGVKRVGS